MSEADVSKGFNVIDVSHNTPRVRVYPLIKLFFPSRLVRCDEGVVGDTFAVRGM